MIKVAPASEIARVYNLKQDSRGYFGPCPFHGGDNPRGLTVLDRDRPVITCHTAGCDWKTTILPELKADGLVNITGDDRPIEPRKPRPKPAPVFKPIGQDPTPTQQQALDIWERSHCIHTDIYQHPYAIAKGLPCYAYGARHTLYRDEPCIVVPQFSLPGWEVCGVQLITGRRTDKGGWEKLNRGPRGIGRVGQIAPDAPIVVVEGWADACWLWEQSEARNPGIVIAFGKVMPVAENLDLYFKGKRTITALEDNDIGC